MAGRVAPGPAPFHGDRMNAVDEFLAEHGFSRAKVAKYAALSPAYNLKQRAEKGGMGENTAHRYRRAFQALDEDTRRQVIAELVQEQGESAEQ